MSPRPVPRLMSPPPPLTPPRLPRISPFRPQERVLVQRERRRASYSLIPYLGCGARGAVPRCAALPPRAVPRSLRARLRHVSSPALAPHLPGSPAPRRCPCPTPPQRQAARGAASGRLLPARLRLRRLPALRPQPQARAVRRARAPRAAACSSPPAAPRPAPPCLASLSAAPARSCSPRPLQTSRRPRRAHREFTPPPQVRQVPGHPHARELLGVGARPRRRRGCALDRGAARPLRERPPRQGGGAPARTHRHGAACWLINPLSPRPAGQTSSTPRRRRWPSAPRSSSSTSCSAAST
jgi:hypothetical protein